MLRPRRKPRALSPRHARRWPLVLAWGIGLAIATGMLLALAYLIGHGTPQAGNTAVNDALRTVGMKGVAPAVAAVALTLLAWCFRHIWFEWLAWRPGRIEVDTFTAGSKLTDADSAQLTLRFRGRLADLRLQAPAPVPGVASGGDFLEVLGGAGADLSSWLGSGLSLLRAAKPSHAWQVNGVLLERAERPRCGLTVQVLRLPGHGDPPQTHWADSWDEAIGRGAAHATAAILPRTCRCQTPWANWRRFVMPGELLDAYEQAVRLEGGRRYDEALDSYYRASAHDPTNMALRLHIGQLQEKLALHLDALSTYQGMLTVAGQGSGRRSFATGRAARSQRRRALLIARYRRIVLLGGSDLAEQWRKTALDANEWSARDKRRRELRGRLQSQLGDELARLTGSDRQDVRALLAEPDPTEAQTLESTRSDPAFLLLRELFARAALEYLRDVLRETQRHVLERSRVLGPAAVSLARLRIELRLEWVRLNIVARRSDRWGPYLAQLEDEWRRHGVAPTGCYWAPDPEQLKRKVARIERRWRFGWHEHYTAAGVYALALLADCMPAEGERDRRDILARCAVERLTSAAAHADSAYIAGRRDWLLSEDPNLDGLRAQTRFKDFESAYFPAEVPTPLRPRHALMLQSSRYIRDLLVATAERSEQTWHARGRALAHDPDVHDVLAWASSEQEAWDLVRNVALDYRHWPARVELIDHLRRRRASDAAQPLEVRFPRYEEEPLPQLDGPDDEATRKARTAARMAAEAAASRLGDLGRAVPHTRGREEIRVEPCHIEGWQSGLRQLDVQGRGPPRPLLAELCDHHAALWQLLGQWLAAGIDAEADAAAAFRSQLKHTAPLWSRTGSQNGSSGGRLPEPVSDLGD